MKISVTQGGRAVALTVSCAGLRGLPGGPGVPGASLIFISSLSWAQIDALVGPELGDAYILTDADVAAPERATGDPAEAGDGLQWNGTAWINIGGPLQGPTGARGPQGEAGPAGAKGDKGDTGSAGPNTISSSTTVTGLTGVLKVSDGAVAGSATATDVGAAPISHTHAASEIASGTIATARLGNGTADSSTYLRGDQTWAAVAGGLSLGETSATAYRGDRGKVAYDHSQSAHAPADATAAGAAGDAFATSHLAAFTHANISNGQTAYGWGNHASAGYALASSLGTAAASAATDFAPAAKGVTNGDSHDHSGGDGGQIAYSSLSGTPTLGTAAAKNIPATGNASATEVVYGSDTRLSDTRTPASHDHSGNKLTQANTHESADTDTATTALHHTLGTGANQAAAGNHGHGDIHTILVMTVANIPAAGDQVAGVLYIGT